MGSHAHAEAPYAHSLVPHGLRRCWHKQGLSLGVGAWEPTHSSGVEKGAGDKALVALVDVQRWWASRAQRGCLMTGGAGCGSQSNIMEK